MEKAEKNASHINVTSVDDELSGRLSVNVVNSKPQTNSTSASSSSQEQINSDRKNSLHVRNEITNVVPCKKAKLLRLERKQNKLLAQGKLQSEIESIMKERKQQNYIKTLEELFEEVCTGLKKLEVIQYQQLNFEIIIYLFYQMFPDSYYKIIFSFLYVVLDMVLFSPIFLILKVHNKTKNSIIAVNIC